LAVAAVQRLDDLAAVDDRDPVGQAEDLVELGRDEQEAGAGVLLVSAILRWMNSVEPTSMPRVSWAAISSLDGRRCASSRWAARTGPAILPDVGSGRDLGWVMRWAIG
jgi:hypothetical protein